MNLIMGMPELYEKKLAEYHKSLKFSSLPLLSWDIHSQHLSDLSNFNKDLDYFKKLLKTSKTEVNIIEEYSENDAVVVITNTDLVIDFASNNLKEMSGYISSEVIGNTPKMFQGPKTDKKIASEIRNKVDNSESFEYTLINYKKDKSLYNCHIQGYPIFDKKGTLIKYVAIEQVA